MKPTSRCVAPLVSLLHTVHCAMQVLEANIAGRPYSHNIRVVRGGLWGWDANLTADPDAKGSHGDWGNVVKEAAEGEKV